MVLSSALKYRSKFDVLWGKYLRFCHDDAVAISPFPGAAVSQTGVFLFITWPRAWQKVGDVLSHCWHESLLSRVSFDVLSFKLLRAQQELHHSLRWPTTWAATLQTWHRSCRAKPIDQTRTCSSRFGVVRVCPQSKHKAGYNPLGVEATQTRASQNSLIFSFIQASHRFLVSCS